LLRRPTLILAGDDDPIIPLVNARIMHRLVPRSEVHIYHGGHLELGSDAERMAPIVEAFLTAENGSETGSAIDEPNRICRWMGAVLGGPRSRRGAEDDTGH